MTNQAERLAIIDGAMYPLLTEIKVLFIQYLNPELSIKEKQSRIIALDKACSTVQKFNPERFITDE
jgi:hypothetical protein